MAFSTSAATMRPRGPLPETRDKSMLLSPASRRASGVTDVPPDVVAGPKLRDGVRTSKNGSSGPDGFVACCGTAAKVAGGAFGADGGGAEAAGALFAAGALAAAPPSPRMIPTTAPPGATSPTSPFVSVPVPGVI